MEIEQTKPETKKEKSNLFKWAAVAAIFSIIAIAIFYYHKNQANFLNEVASNQAPMMTIAPIQDIGKPKEDKVEFKRETKQKNNNQQIMILIRLGNIDEKARLYENFTYEIEQIRNITKSSLISNELSLLEKNSQIKFKPDYYLIKEFENRAKSLLHMEKIKSYPNNNIKDKVTRFIIENIYIEKKGEQALHNASELERKLYEINELLINNDYNSALEKLSEFKEKNHLVFEDIINQLEFRVALTEAHKIIFEDMVREMGQ